MFASWNYSEIFENIMSDKIEVCSQDQPRVPTKDAAMYETRRDVKILAAADTRDKIKR